MSSSQEIPKPDLTEHEEESTPFDDVMRRLLEAKPAPKTAEKPDRLPD